MFWSPRIRLGHRQFPVSRSQRTTDNNVHWCHSPGIYSFRYPLGACFSAVLMTAATSSSHNVLLWVERYILDILLGLLWIQDSSHSAGSAVWTIAIVVPSSLNMGRSWLSAKFERTQQNFRDTGSGWLFFSLIETIHGSGFQEVDLKKPRSLATNIRYKLWSLIHSARLSLLLSFFFPSPFSVLAIEVLKIGCRRGDNTESQLVAYTGSL